MPAETSPPIYRATVHGADSESTCAAWRPTRACHEKHLRHGRAKLSRLVSQSSLEGNKAFGIRSAGLSTWLNTTFRNEGEERTYNDATRLSEVTFDSMGQA